MTGEERPDAPAHTAVELAESAGKQPRRLARVDPGLATMVAAGLALVGTIVTVVAQRDGGDSAQPSATATATSGTDTSGTSTKVIATSGTTVVETTGAPSTAPTTTPTTTSASTTTPSTSSPASSADSVPPPVVNLLPMLPPDERSQIESAATTILNVAQGLPVLVDDDFVDNINEWPEYRYHVGDSPICTWSVTDGAYRTAIETDATAGWCSEGLQRTAADFLLSVDAELANSTDSDVAVLFRVQDDGRRFVLTMSPTRQTLALAYADADTTAPVFAPVYVEDIDSSESNNLTVLALGSNLVIYVNDRLIAMVDDQRLVEPGRTQVYVMLNAPHSKEALDVTHFTWRGA